MAASPANFLFGFLFVSIILWFFFTFASRLVAWILGRILKASVGFRVGGWKCLRDVVVKFKKGAIETVSVGEIRLSLRQSLVKLGIGFISRDPKVQVLICDLEVVMRSSNKSTQRGIQKSRSRKKPGTSGRGKWMVVANMARFLSISITELVVKTPKATIEVKELGVDISKDGTSKTSLFVKLQILPIFVHLGDSRASYDQASLCNITECISTTQASSAMLERVSAPFSCEEFSLLCELGHERDAGVVVRSIDITSGEVALNLNEELFTKKKSSSDAFAHVDEAVGLTTESGSAKRAQKKQGAFLAISKYTSMFPEKLFFNLPKLDLKFVHRGHDLAFENNIMGIQLKSIKSRSIEDVGESTRLDVQMDFSEIHLLREAGMSVVEILKLAVSSSVYVPLQPSSPIRSEIDIKLGGTQCNIIMARLKHWMRLRSSGKKKLVLQEESSNPKNLQPTAFKAIVWTCTVSAPEMTILLHNLNGMLLYHGCSQSSHIFANNISSSGASVHMELGEINLHMADEDQECLKESLYGMETNTGSLIHVGKIGFDWGKKDLDPVEEDGLSKLVLVADVTGMGVYLTYKRVESLVSTALSFKDLLKNLSASGKKQSHSEGGHSTRSSGKGIQLMKCNLERCSVSFYHDVDVENTVIADPKRVNYGSQGGQVVISDLADGTPRVANIMSSISDDCKKLKYSLYLDIYQFSLCMNKEKQSMQMELERARSTYQECLEDSSPGNKVSLFDMQNAKFLRRSGGVKEVAVCSLFSATDIAVRWEPDVHITLFELVLHLKLLVQTKNLQGIANEHHEDISRSKYNEQKKESSVETVQFERKHKKKESVFAIDVEMLSIFAEAGDGVDAMIQIQSIFSENARIGVLSEGLMLCINGARIFKSSRMQISRIPNASNSVSHTKTEAVSSWDCFIQAFDVHVCMPYRLQLRAIDDSVEEMLRALKLITRAKTRLVLPSKEEVSKSKKHSSSKLGCVRFCIRKLTIDIEEEPLQGWLDEHYQLMKNEALELAVRLNFLDEFISKHGQPHATAETSDCIPDGKIQFNGEDLDVQDSSAVDKLREEIYKQSFRSYYRACQNLVPSEGSGAYKEGFQAGFKSSTTRTSLFSISATEIDVRLTRIEGGDAGMIEILHKLDPVCSEYNIPFSRLYGSNIQLQAGSLIVQIRNYTYPLFAGISGKCEGRLVLAQQATCFQPQIYQNVYIGRWRKVRMLRSVTGTTPPIKTFLDLPLHFQKVEVAYGVGFEPPFADVSYAFTVALRRANLSTKNPNPDIPPPKKEKSLPWWDEMRNYIHGRVSLFISETRWHVLATTDPYEKSDKLQIISGPMEIQQSDGRVFVSAKDFKIVLSSLESLLNSCSLKVPTGACGAFIESPAFTVEVTMDWGCESGTPLNHYLFALPKEGVPREKVYDPFRSTSLSLRWNLSLRPSLPLCENQFQSSSMGEDVDLDGSAYGPSSKSKDISCNSPIMYVGPHDLAWLIKFWNLNYLPPHKLRTFSRWPRFGVPRIPRSGNLSMDKVITEFMFRVDSTPSSIKHMPLDDDDPAKGLTFKMTKLKYELYFGRGTKQKYTFECKRDPLDLVYQGLDLHMPKAFVNKEDCTSVAKVVQMTRKNSQSASMDRISSEKSSLSINGIERHRDEGFLLSSDYFTIRRQAPKADPARLLAWQDTGRRNLEMTYVRSEFEHGSESDEHTRSDPSDDDGYNVVIADNCQRIFVYGLKLLWTIENRDAVWSWVGGLSKAFQPPKPSPSRQYAQRKLLEEHKDPDGSEMAQDDSLKSASICHGANSPSSGHGVKSPSSQPVETPGSLSSPSHSVKVESPSSDTVAKTGDIEDTEEEGTRHFMVNVIEPQFNLHSEEANGRFLLAAVSGRVLARSFHSVLHVGYEMIKQALGTGNVQSPESQPEMTWNRMEISVMLEYVQAHVAPTDIDPGAGLQWLPRIHRSSPKVKRTGALLERVFMPCDMYFRYTRHKGGTTDLKVKPLKELTFNSHNITATMTSRQFQVMLDVLTNLLFARLPKPRKNTLSYPAEDDEDVEEEADEVVPAGVEEVELARVNLEQKERQQKVILRDIRGLSVCSNTSGEPCSEKEGDLWMIAGGRFTLVQKLKKELVNAQESRKGASTLLRQALQKAAQLRLMEKEKNKSPSYAMRISLQINKVVWSMLLDGKSFAETEINDMIYDFERDYKDVGVSRFTTKYFVVRNCLPNSKSDMLLSAWNPPPEWGKKAMLRVDTKQGAPKEGNSPLELFQVEIYPLKIHLTERMYKMMWDYFFPEEEPDSKRRQDAWKVSTTVGSRRVKKGSSMNVASSSNQSMKENEAPIKSGASVILQSLALAETSKSQNQKKTNVGTSELRRTSSSDRTWEENVAESVANELVLQVHSSGLSSLKSGPLGSGEQQDEVARSKSKDSKPIKTGRSSHEDKKVAKTQDEKRTRPRKLREFHNIKISQVELLVTYEGSRFAVSDLRLLMDAFHRVEFTGTWRRLFSRVKKHIIWGVLKSVTGMQGKKFKDKAITQKEVNAASVPDSDLILSDSDGGSAGKSDQYPLSWPKRPSDGAGDGFVTSIRGLFNSQRRKAKAFMRRTMRGETENELHGEWSLSDAEFSPFARQLTITNARKLLRRHTKKFRSRGKGLPSDQRDSLPSSPRETTPFASESSSESSPYEDFND